MYIHAAKSSEATEQLFFRLSRIKKPNAIEQAYLGSTYFFKAAHSYNPIHKFQYFNKGKDFMDRAVRQKPDNTEIRFLRLAAQMECPSFLGYTHHISQDKARVLAGIGLLEDDQLKSMICNYLLRSDRLSDREKKPLRTL